MNARTEMLTIEPRAALPSPLHLHHGGQVARGTVRYCCSESDGPPLVLLGGVSAHAEWTWWPRMVGSGLTIDPDHNQLVGIEYLDEPTVDPRDQAHAVVAVLDHLGLDRVRVVGASYGGMVALALGEVAPERVERMMVIAAAHRPHALGTAWRTIQRRILDLAVHAGAEHDGVALARALAMTTFRSPQEFENRFGQPGIVNAGDAQFPVDSYLNHNGERYARRFSAATYRALITSVDLHQVDPKAVPVPVHVVGYTNDALVPPSIVKELAEGLPDCRSLHLLDSIHGHDAFLTDPEPLAPLIRAALLN
ncbi:MAG: alpha/beta fold hydrolase [Myxococcota bacterium]